MKEFRFALRQTFPIFFTYLFLGTAFGVLMAEAGYPPWLSGLMAVVIYAGSMQLVLVPLLVAKTSLPMLAVMTLFINGRHIFYGIAMIERFRSMGWRFPYMIHALTDETYSILCSVRYDEGLDEKQAAFWIALQDHSYWILGCVLGTCLGRYFHIGAEGIDFSCTAFFLVVVINQWRESRSHLPAFCGLFFALLFFVLLGPDRFLIPALCASTIALVLLRETIEKQEARL